MNIPFDQIATRIIKEQELIIGPIAWQEAVKVEGLDIHIQDSAEINQAVQDPKEVINKLVGRYELLFGRASREACKDAVASIIAELSPADIPSSLRSV